MIIPFLLLWTLFLSSGCSPTATDNSESFKVQASISELQDVNYVLEQKVESVNSAIAQLKSFIQEEFNKEHYKTNSNASKLCYCEDQLEKNAKTIAEDTEQLKLKEELSLNKAQDVVDDFKHQLENQNKIIFQNTEKISQLTAQIETMDQALKDIQSKFEENENQLKKQKAIIEQMEEVVVKLRESCKSSLSDTHNVGNTATNSQLEADVETLKDTPEKEQTKNNEKPTDCTSFGDSNGVHNIKIPNFEAFPVLCNSEIAGPGWTVIQQRINGGEDFYRDWETYKNGFGNFTGDFFLGLEKIHRLTNNTPHELYIYMEEFKTRTYGDFKWVAHYDNFRIAGEDDKYRVLSLGLLYGQLSFDKMRDTEFQQFSTFDSDNDASSGDCAKKYHAGWWYNDCSNCNLNGKYYQRQVEAKDSNWWYFYQSLKTIKMMIRPLVN